VDLARAIAEGSFREDLYFRLNVIEIAVPPLRQRPDDVLPLCRHFLAEAARAEGADVPVLAEEAQQALLAHDWSGNVRELENRARRALLVGQGGTIRAEDLGLAPATHASAPPARHDPAQPDDPRTRDPERAQIEAALVEAQGVVSRAAAQLGVSRQALYRRMERLGIELERRPK
jgi:DNA-binding NtrC family response regulator